MKLVGLRKIPQNKIFGKGDVFVLFGELFGKGYANGLIQQARAHQMQIIGITVGRRDAARNLRELTSQELQASEANLGGKIINIPLEAGFDLEQVDGSSLVDVVNTIDKKDWKNAKLDRQHILACKKQAEAKFAKMLQKTMEMLYEKIPSQKNIFFAHTMAGGFIRSKLLFLIANRVFKGKGVRHESSGEFWKSDLGQLCCESFYSVTADTFHSLVISSQKIRERNEAQGKYVFYSAYGYHGTEILLDNKFQWQTYIPYQQGHAKKRLENYAREFAAQNINTVVYNCPEIRTDSSGVFAGVELPLLVLITALKKFHPSSWTTSKIKFYQNLLKDGVELDEILYDLEVKMSCEIAKKSFIFEDWPTENNKEISNLLIGTSEQINLQHKNNKDLISDHLSRLTIQATGHLIFDYASNYQQAVIWLGHDIVVKKLSQLYPA